MAGCLSKKYEIVGLNAKIAVINLDKEEGKWKEF